MGRRIAKLLRTLPCADLKRVMVQWREQKTKVLHTDPCGATAFDVSVDGRRTLCNSVAVRNAKHGIANVTSTATDVAR